MPKLRMHRAWNIYAVISVFENVDANFGRRDTYHAASMDLSQLEVAGGA